MQPRNLAERIFAIAAMCPILDIPDRPGTLFHRGCCKLEGYAPSRKKIIRKRKKRKERWRYMSRKKNERKLKNKKIKQDRQDTLIDKQSEGETEREREREREREGCMNNWYV